MNSIEKRLEGAGDGCRDEDDSLFLRFKLRIKKIERAIHRMEPTLVQYVDTFDDFLVIMH